jgi:hypothetical protein
MPSVARLWPPPAQLVGKALPELQAPAPDALVGDDHASLGQQQLDAPPAQAEHVVEPDGVADDLGRKAMAAMCVWWLAHVTSLHRPATLNQPRST